MPILGQLFKSRLFRERQTDLVVFITPSFIDGQPDAASPTNRGRALQAIPMRMPEVREQIRDAGLTMLTLSIQSDDQRPLLHKVDRMPCRIGKHRDNEVVLPSWRVARVHAEIHPLERGFKLIDCGSIGGTLVNGERIVEHGLLDVTDEITIAGFRLRIEPQLSAGRELSAMLPVALAGPAMASTSARVALAGLPPAEVEPGAEPLLTAGQTSLAEIEVAMAAIDASQIAACDRPASQGCAPVQRGSTAP